MNAMKVHRKYQKEQEIQKYKDEMEAERQKMAAMSPEEREQYVEAKRAEMRKTLELLNAPATMLRDLGIVGPYATGK